MMGAVLVGNIHAQTIAASQRKEKTPVDALIPWLLQEDAQLRGIPFSEVIFDATGKHVLAFNPKDRTRCISLSVLSMRNQRLTGSGNSHVGTWSTSHISK